MIYCMCVRLWEENHEQNVHANGTCGGGIDVFKAWYCVVYPGKILCSCFFISKYFLFWWFGAGQLLLLWMLCLQLSHWPLGIYSLRRRRLISIGIPIINLRRSSDRLRFIMGIPIPVRRRLLIPPLHRGCDLCASLVRPQNWPGRRWRQKGGRTVALVVQGWHIGRSDIAMDAMVAGKFWACSKQSHKGRRGGRSLTGRSKEAGWRHTHRRGRRMDAQWSAIGRPVKNANIVYQFERHICLSCTTIVPPLADQWRPLSNYSGDHVLCLHSATMATFEPPWQWFCLHSAFFVRPVVPLQQFWARRSQPCVKGALVNRGPGRCSCDI